MRSKPIAVAGRCVRPVHAPETAARHPRRAIATDDVEPRSPTARRHNRRKCLPGFRAAVLRSNRIIRQSVRRRSSFADRCLLGELLGQAELRELSDAEVPPSRIGTTSTTNASAPFQVAQLERELASAPADVQDWRARPDALARRTCRFTERRKCPHAQLTRRLVRSPARRRIAAEDARALGDAGRCAERVGWVREPARSPYRHPPRLQCRHTGGARTGGPGAPGAHASAGIARDRRARRRLSARAEKRTRTFLTHRHDTVDETDRATELTRFNLDLSTLSRSHSRVSPRGDRNAVVKSVVQARGRQTAPRRA